MSKQQFKTLHTSALTSEKLAGADHITERLYVRLHLASNAWGVMSANPRDVLLQAVPGVTGFDVSVVSDQLDVLAGIKLIERWVFNDSPWLYLSGYTERLSADQKRKRTKNPVAVPPSLGGEGQPYSSPTATNGSPRAAHASNPAPQAKGSPTAAQGQPKGVVVVEGVGESSNPLLQQRDTAPNAAAVVDDDEATFDQKRALTRTANRTPNPLDVLGNQIDQSLTDRLTTTLSEVLDDDDARRFAGLITGSKIMGYYSDGGGSKRKYDAGTWERATNVVVRLVRDGKIRIDGDGPIGFIITRLHEHTESGSDRVVEQKKFTPGVKRDETAEEIQARFMARATGVAS